jgi:hypothetical protein
LIIPVLLGYGPAVSSGVTTQFEADMEPAVTVVLDVVVELALTGDDEQAARAPNRQGRAFRAAAVW